MYGHGFIYRDKVISAAHVLSSSISGVFVTEGGRLRDITHLTSSPPNRHSTYDKIEASHPVGKEALVTLALVPFDLGYVSLKQSVKSDFEVVGYESVPEMLKGNRARGVKNQLSLAQIEVERADLKRLVFSSVVPVIRGATTVLNDVDAIALSIDFDNDGIAFTNQKLEAANIFIDTSLPLKPGHSGTPLFARASDGRLLVTGVASTVVSLSAYPKDIEGQQNLFATSLNLKDLIELGAKPELGIKMRCRRAFGS